MQCKHCGAEVGSEYRLCPYCKCEMEDPTKNNNQPTIIIQNIIDPNAIQTQNQAYGNQMYYNNDNTYPAKGNMCSQKNKTVALLLVLILGFFGAHRFYAGKVVTGIIWFLTGGLFLFGWFYDMIKIASGTFKDGNGMPIQ